MASRGRRRPDPPKLFGWRVCASKIRNRRAHRRMCRWLQAPGCGQSSHFCPQLHVCPPPGRWIGPSEPQAMEIPGATGALPPERRPRPLNVVRRVCNAHLLTSYPPTNQLRMHPRSVWYRCSSVSPRFEPQPRSKTPAPHDLRLDEQTAPSPEGGGLDRHGPGTADRRTRGIRVWGCRVAVWPASGTQSQPLLGPVGGGIAEPLPPEPIIRCGVGWDP